MIRAFGSLAVLVILGSTALAQDVTSGPAKGEKVPGLKVYDATGANKEKDFDYGADRKGKPTIFIFIQGEKFDRPMGRFLKTLDNEVKDIKDAYVVAVWLTDKTDETKDRLPKINMSLKFEATALALYTGKDTPKDWTINSDAHLTAVVTSKEKVAETFGYMSINEKDVKGVIESLKKAIDKK